MTNGAPYVSATAYNHLMCGEIHKMHREREVNRDSGGLNERFNVNKYKTIREMAHTVTDARMRKTEGGREPLRRGTACIIQVSFPMNASLSKGDRKLFRAGIESGPFFFSLVLYHTQKVVQFFFFFFLHPTKGQMSKMKFKTERARKPAAGQSRRQIEDVSDLTGPGAQS